MAQGVDMVILQLFFHVMLAIIQFVSFLAIAFAASNIFKSGSWNGIKIWPYVDSKWAIANP
jgi:hypothetical protein